MWDARNINMLTASFPFAGDYMPLPAQQELQVNLLAQCFNNTSATYKFYWFLSIIQEVEKGNLSPLKKDLFAGMVSNAWYTVNYFHVSFGKQDMLQRAIENVLAYEKLFVDEPSTKVFDRLTAPKNKSTVQELNYFNKEVPWRFLSPWIKDLEKEVYKRSGRFENNCLYSLYSNHIEVNPEWIPYLLKNAGILKSFCYWKLSLYLQKHNPNVPDIPNKLIKPAKRNNLTEQRKFWNIILNELGSVDCIYTGNKLSNDNFAIEHFIPYAFVSHDLMWNLIPADKSFNCSKNDKLPSMSQYFDSFFALQKTAIEVIKVKAPKNKFLEDYLSIFPDLESMNINPRLFKDRYRDGLQPLITIASNNGFEFMR